MKELFACLLLLSSFVKSENVMSLTKEFNLNNEIYKVLTLDEWEQVQASGAIITELDKADGFIHLSLATQLNTTLYLYFAQEESVVLLQVDHSQTHDRIKFEAPVPLGDRSGLFPHYYGDLNTDAVSRVWYLKRDAFEMPIEVMLQAEQGDDS